MLDSSWGAFLRPFRPHWKTLLLNCVACVAVGLLLALVLPKRYTAKATLLPPSEEQTGLSMSSLVRGITVPGIRVPLAVTPSDMVLSVLQSIRVRTAVGADVGANRIFNTADTLAALEKLRKRSSFRVTPLGVIEIAVTAPTAQDAAALANAYVSELDKFTRGERMSKGHRTRVFIEQRLADVRAHLDTLQDKVSQYQMKHHAAALGASTTSSVESSAKMFADRMNLQFQLELARSYSSENSQEVRLLEARLAALDHELDRLPPLGMEMATLLRDVKSYEQAYAFLTAQYEDARIEEARDVVAVDVLDPATPPRKPSFPRKRYFAAGAFAIGLLGSLGWVLAGAPGSRNAPRA